MKVNIGLDIGIASVGWAVADADSFKLIERGVRLFDPMDDQKGKLENEKRRQARSARRQTQRRRNLKIDFVKLLCKYKMIDYDIDSVIKKKEKINLKEIYDGYINNASKNDIDILGFRLEALKNKVVTKDLLIILYWYLSNRGFSYELAEDEDFKSANEKFGSSIDSKKFVVENQMSFYKEKGYFRCELNRMFSTKEYLRELKEIFKHQNCNLTFIDEYFKLFERRRSFEIGPGPKEDSIAKLWAQKYPVAAQNFSRWHIDSETGEWKSFDNMWEGKIGKCSVYPSEDRLHKSSIFAEIFNLLNDLNNMRITKDEIHLSNDQKIDIVNLSLQNQANLNKTVKYLKVDEMDIFGLRINAKKEKLLTELNSVGNLKSAFKKIGIDIQSKLPKFNGANFLDYEFLNNITKIIANNQELEKRIVALKNVDFIQQFHLDENQIKDLAKSLKASSGTHALSKKAILEYSKLLIETSQNFMQLSYNDQKKNLEVKVNKYIPIKWIDDSNFIASPTTKRAIRQTIKVLNALIKHRDYRVDNIVIELARELNSEAKSDNMKELQKNLEATRKLLKVKIDDFESRGKKVKGQALAKLWLYEQQLGKDPYDGEELNLEEVICNPSYSDIDHIIPYSQSYDDSRNNKVLTKASHNSKKKNQTPYQYITSTFGEDKFFNLIKLWENMFKNNASDKSYISYKKYVNMISSKDYSKAENQLDFIQRNIVDTRYATKMVLEHVLKFTQNVESTHNWHGAKIKVVNGKLTNFIRKHVERGNKLERPDGFLDGSIDEKGIKIRDWNGHHSEDAYFIIWGALKNLRLNKWIEKVLSEPYAEGKAKEALLASIDEIIDKSEQGISLNANEIREELNSSINNVKFSYMLTKKNNVQLFNETLYGGKWTENEKGEAIFRKVEKIKLVGEKEKLIKIFDGSNKYRTQMELHDPKAFAELKKIFDNNIDKKEPFENNDRGLVTIAYWNDKKEQVIRKISKLTILTEKKDKKTVVIKQDQSNGSSFNESLDWVQLWVYKNKDNENRIIPINASNAIFINGETKLNIDNLKLYMCDRNIDFDSEPFYKINRGTIVRDESNHLYNVCGHQHDLNIIKLKRIDGFGKVQPLGISTQIKNWEIIEQDEIANYKKIAKF